MTSQIDLYTICPCGSGKKIKFCCPKELHGDYEKLLQLSSSGQRAAAIEAADRVLQKHPDQSCFLVAKATNLLAMSEFEGVRAVQQRLQEKHPNNPVTYALLVLLSLVEQDVDAAQDAMQQTFALIADDMPPLVEAALPELIVALAATGSVFSSLGLANLYVSIAGESAQDEVMQLLNHLRSDPGNPVSWKEAWMRNIEREFQLAGDHPLLNLYPRGRWRAAAELAESWLQENPQSALGLAVSALMHAWLDQDDTAADRFRRLAKADDVSEMMAVAAQLAAHSLDPQHDAQPLRQISVTFPIVDFERAMEQAISDPRAQNIPGDMRMYVAENEVPPRAVFHLIDKPLLENMAEAQVKDLSEIKATAVLFGKETDRDARLVVYYSATEDTPVPELAGEIFGDTIGAPGDRDLKGYVDGLLAQMNRRVLFPRGTTPADVARLRQQIFEHAICELWPNQPHGFLQGKTPLEAATDPALRRPLLAALLHLESTSPYDSWEGDFNRIWEKVGLQHDVAGADFPATFWLIEITRLNPTQVALEKLEQYAMIAAVSGLRAASNRLARELLKNPLAEREHSFIILSSLQRVISNDDLQLKLVRVLIDWCRHHQQPAGQLRLLEFQLLLQAGKSAEAQNTLQILTTQHRNEPEVMQQLFAILQQIGAIGPDGSVRGPQAPAAPAPAAEPGKLWTPDQPAPEQPGQGGGKLWLPGMD